MEQRDQGTADCARCRTDQAHLLAHGEGAMIAIAGLFLGAGLALRFLTSDPVLFAPGIHTSALLYLSSVATGGSYVARRGWEAIRRLELGINALMTIAILGAIAIGEFVEAASLAFLFSLAELLEDFATERAKGSLRELMQLAPQEARVLGGGPERKLPVERVQVGDVIAVRPGERIPLDGQVQRGVSAVDEAPITGESFPVEKGEGDPVFAGSIVQEGYFEIAVTKPAEETTLAKIIHLVQEAEAQKAPSERFVERFGRIYTPTVVGVATFAAIIPPVALSLPFSEWFLRAITLLVIACPCALLISTPVSVISAITSGARQGVLIKGGRHLEELGGIAAIAFDKTGTLTTGELTVTDAIPLNGRSEREVLGLAASVEHRSGHPIAQAIRNRADELRLQLELEALEAFEAIPGRGVHARIDGHRYLLGTPELFEGSPVEIPERELSRLQGEGKTTMLLGTEGELWGLIAVADQLRPHVKTVIERLQRMDLEVVMVTGDNEGTAQAIARQLGISHYHARLLPHEKVHEIGHLMDEHGSVVMVGDGVNDAPALATATIGIAMGAAGSDTALETADIALLADDLSRLPYLIELGRRARRVIHQNIWSSIAVKLALGLGVFPGWVSLVLAVLVGDMGMTLSVTGNAMRLARTKS